MKKLAFAALAAAAAMAGCISPPQNNIDYNAPIDSRVTVAPDIGGDVVVTDVRCAKGSGSYLTFQANLANSCSFAVPVEWKVQWLDADGIEIDSVVSTWNARMLQPYELCGLKATAPTPSAADMRFYVRRKKQ